MNQNNNESRKINRKKLKENAQKRNRKGGIFNKILFLLALIMFLYATYQLYTIFAEYKEGEKEYVDIIDLVVTQDQKDDNNLDFQVDFKTLKAINGDTVGWIRFEEPSVINYPLVQGRDNYEYLTKTFQANDNKLGAIFVDAYSQPDFSDRNTIIYGHNMKNGSMFSKLNEYKSQEFHKQYPNFYIYTPDGGKIVYQICAVSIIKDTSELYQTQFESDMEWQNYIDMMKGASLYNTGVTVTKDAKIVSLSTCTNVADDERLLVQGIKVGEE